jgi:hypothetical protein
MLLNTAATAFLVGKRNNPFTFKAFENASGAASDVDRARVKALFGRMVTKLMVVPVQGKIRQIERYVV